MEEKEGENKKSVFSDKMESVVLGEATQFY